MAGRNLGGGPSGKHIRADLSSRVVGSPGASCDLLNYSWRQARGRAQGSHRALSLRAPPQTLRVGWVARPAWGERTCSQSPKSGRSRGPARPQGSVERESRVKTRGIGWGGPRPSPSPTHRPLASVGASRPGRREGRAPFSSRLLGLPNSGAGMWGPRGRGARAGGVPGSGRAGTNTSLARREAQGRPERAR